MAKKFLKRKVHSAVHSRLGLDFEMCNLVFLPAAFPKCRPRRPSAKRTLASSFARVDFDSELPPPPNSCKISRKQKTLSNTTVEIYETETKRKTLSNTAVDVESFLYFLPDPFDKSDG